MSESEAAATAGPPEVLVAHTRSLIGFALEVLAELQADHAADIHQRIALARAERFLSAADRAVAAAQETSADSPAEPAVAGVVDYPLGLVSG